MFRALSLLLATLFALNLTARPVTQDEATLAAKAWVDRATPLRLENAQVQAIEAVPTERGDTLYYKVLLNNRHVLILSSDTHITPVVAVIEHHRLKIPASHPLLELLHGDLSRRHAVFVTAAASPEHRTNLTLATLVTQHQAQWDALLSCTPPPHPTHSPAILGGWERGGRLTHWYQESYNAYGDWEPGTVYDRHTPQHAPTGCVATAGAALLEFFRVPEGPSGLTRTCRLSGEPITLATKGGRYDWALLPAWRKGVEVSEEARELLGRVSYDVGVCTGTWYDPRMSGSTPYSLARALPEVFGIHVTYLQGAAQGDKKLIAAQHIYPQVRKGAPVVLGLMGTHSGHAAIAVGYAEDGFKTPFTRLFMGWGSRYDTWYALPETDIAGFNFPLLRDALTDLYKE